MAISDLILKPGQILITANQSSAKGISLDNSSFIFGNVAKACEISDYYTAGDYVMFNPKDTSVTKILDGSTLYYLTNERNVYLTENYIAP